MESLKLELDTFHIKNGITRPVFIDFAWIRTQ